MSIKYYHAPEVKRLVNTIIAGLHFNHIDSTYVYCVRSRGSRSKHTIARVHSLGKPWQLALNAHPRYLIEVIAERYDRLSRADQERILIHELLHIPKGFSGGFRHHKGYISNKIVRQLHERFKSYIAREIAFYRL